MHWDGDVTAGIMLRDGGQQECCFPSFCIYFSTSFFIFCVVRVQRDRA